MHAIADAGTTLRVMDVPNVHLIGASIDQFACWMTAAQHNYKLISGSPHPQSLGHGHVIDDCSLLIIIIIILIIVIIIVMMTLFIFKAHFGFSDSMQCLRTICRAGASAPRSASTVWCASTPPSHPRTASNPCADPL